MDYYNKENLIKQELNEIVGDKRQRSSIEDYNIDDILENPICQRATQNGYDRKIKLFYDFVGITSNEIKHVDYLSDKNIATFLYSQGNENEWKAHSKKLSLAALNNELKYFAK